jgi:hypothetical protein
MIFAVATLSFVLTCAPRRCTSLEENGILVFDSNVQTINWNPDPTQKPEISVSGNLEMALAQDLASIQDVRYVLTERAEGNLLVWIIIDNAESYESRSRVYEKELGLLDAFPEENFDFNLIPSREGDPRTFATGAQVVYSRY